MKSLDTLVTDIYSLFDPGTTHDINEENLDRFAENLKDLLRQRLSSSEHSGLRFSNLGRGDRYLWYETHPGEREALTPKTYFKFLYGDVIEQLVVFLAREAGHRLTDEQAEVEVDGVKGHIDGVLDGVVIDVKSASPYGYKKFEQNLVLEDDPFGYVSQLAGYADILTPDRGAAWIAFDKVSGDICVTPLSRTVISDNKPAPRIAHLKEIVANAEPPPRCYPDIEDGKSGNRKLGVGCSYCHHKFRCWDGLRVFAYSGGPRFLTRVEKTPDVYEITREEADIPE